MKTSIAQRLPNDFDDKLIKLQRYVIKLRNIHGFTDARTANADQTPLTFDIPFFNKTVSSTGSKTVVIKTTGNEKNHFTVMLDCFGDGSKMEPYVVF